MSTEVPESISQAIQEVQKLRQELNMREASVATQVLVENYYDQQKNI